MGRRPAPRAGLASGTGAASAPSLEELELFGACLPRLGKLPSASSFLALPHELIRAEFLHRVKSETAERQTKLDGT